MRGWFLLIVIAALLGLLVREILRRYRTVEKGRDAAKEIEAVRAEADDRFAERRALAAEEPGGTPDNPIVVAASSVVEARAENEPCLRCGGPVRVDEHAVEPFDGVTLRVAHVRCPRCGHRRRRYFRIRPPTPELH